MQKSIGMQKNSTLQKMNMELKSSKKEKLFFSFGQVAVNIVWLLPGSFLTMYYTDSVGISATFLGTMMLLARLFDGFSDVLFGTILDKTRTKWGKARPWILFMALPVVLSLIALFTVPTGIGDQATKIYVFTTYFIMTVVTYTVINIAVNALLPRFSLTSQDRAITTVISTIFALITILTLNMIIPSIIEKNGGFSSPHAWFIVVIAVGMVALVGLLIAFFGIKERIPLEQKPEQGEKSQTFSSIKMMLSNRYFILSLALFLANNILTGTQSINLYYARDVFGDANLFGIMSLIGIAPMILFMPFVPLFFKKFGKRNTICAGMIISAFALLLMLLNPTNTTWFFIFSLLRGIGSAPMTAAVGTLAGDVVDYNHWKTGVRKEGIAVSMQSIGAKLGTGIGSALLGWILGWSGYNSLLAVQSEATIRAMIIICIVIPFIVSILVFTLMLFWNIEKHQEEITEFIISQEIHEQS
ncbi:MAG: MFS transporter [Lachnospiraceae bacterium]